MTLNSIIITAIVANNLFIFTANDLRALLSANADLRMDADKSFVQIAQLK